ncbi:MAG: cytochrome c [Myxococcota bacterium]|nr:cytochrome c [Myxococcota bacterium]
MKYLLSSAFLSVAVVFGLLLVPVTPSEAGDDGATSFKNFCSTCHGDAGAGDGPASAGLDPKPANFQEPKFWEGKTDDYLKKVIKEGGAAVGKSSAMAAWGNVLSDAQVDAVIAHIKTFKKK